MAFKLGYATLRWQNPDLEPALEALAEAGWDGWEGRLSLDWMGPPKRLRRICENTGMPLAVLTAKGTPEERDWANVELNKRRIEYAAEMGVDCFMYMSGNKPEGRPVNDDDLKRAAAGADDWADYAAQVGVELSYHIHTNLLVDSVADWTRYMALLQTARLCIDVSHAQLWGYEPNASLRDFKNQLNYVHLQDYASTSRREDGFYLPVWVDVGQAGNVDFPAIRHTLEEIQFDRWVTGCPGEPIPGAEDPLSEARRSKRMVDYLRGLGY